MVLVGAVGGLLGFGVGVWVRAALPLGLVDECAVVVGEPEVGDAYAVDGCGSPELQTAPTDPP